jgi:hypothetical protein
MKPVVRWLNESAYIPPLSPACEMCAEGSKLVVLATGLCQVGCFYCPLSFKKGGTDRIFADEWELNDEKDTQKLIQETTYIKATGAGITGGDPMIVWKRVENYIRLLKERFGAAFHIHLYTAGRSNTEHISDLVTAGLDEIRFHLPPVFWDKMDKSHLKPVIQELVDREVDVAVEIPVIPGMEKQILLLIQWANEMGLQWINLNELEFSERNHNALTIRGFEVKSDISAAVRGSQESALNVLDQVCKGDFNIGVHYCSVSFKDGVQLKNRITRRAQSVAKAYDVISDDGTLVKGVVCKQDVSLHETIALLKHRFDIPDKYIFLDREKHRIEIGLWILEKIASKLKAQGYECYMVEEYPTADRLEVERIPLPL